MFSGVLRENEQISHDERLVVEPVKDPDRHGGRVKHACSAAPP
jgi:hypothetical protein